MWLDFVASYHFHMLIYKHQLLHTYRDVLVWKKMWTNGMSLNFFFKLVTYWSWLYSAWLHIILKKISLIDFFLFFNFVIYKKLKMLLFIKINCKHLLIYKLYLFYYNLKFYK